MPCETRAFAGGVASVTAPDEAESLVTRSHEPTATARHVFNVVLNSGHFRVSRKHRVDERRVSGHELLYCVNGSGYVVSGEETISP